jgi:CRP-like cAMP-binding protein
MPCFSDDLRVNHLLGALTEDDLHVLQPHLELVELRSGQRLCDADAPNTYMYFPTTAVMSLLYVMEEGGIVEVAAIGREGLVGVQTLAGGATPSRVEVRSGGNAYRIAVSTIRKTMSASPGLYRIVLIYMQVMMTQMAQSALCTKSHTILQQLSRWLLIAHDQLVSDDLVMTQQMIANMLGVRREGVTEAAGKLHKLGVIRYARGQITVLDRPQLEKLCCECYAVVKKESDRLLPRPNSKPPRKSRSAGKQ